MFPHRKLKKLQLEAPECNCYTSATISNHHNYHSNRTVPLLIFLWKWIWFMSDFLNSLYSVVLNRLSQFLNPESKYKMAWTWTTCGIYLLLTPRVGWWHRTRADVVSGTRPVLCISATFKVPQPELTHSTTRPFITAPYVAQIWS